MHLDIVSLKKKSNFDNENSEEEVEGEVWRGEFCTTEIIWRKWRERPSSGNGGSNGQMDACRIHSGCTKDNGLFPSYVGSEWRCSDDQEGDDVDDADPCQIRGGCMLPDAWPQYDTSAGAWKCCDEISDGCDSSSNPKNIAQS